MRAHLACVHRHALDRRSAHCTPLPLTGFAQDQLNTMEEQSSSDDAWRMATYTFVPPPPGEEAVVEPAEGAASTTGDGDREDHARQPDASNGAPLEQQAGADSAAEEQKEQQPAQQAAPAPTPAPASSIAVVKPPVASSSTSGVAVRALSSASVGHPSARLPPRGGGDSSALLLQAPPPLRQHHTTSGAAQLPAAEGALHSGAGASLFPPDLGPPLDDPPLASTSDFIGFDDQHKLFFDEQFTMTTSPQPAAASARKAGRMRTNSLLATSTQHLHPTALLSPTGAHSNLHLHHQGHADAAFSSPPHHAATLSPSSPPALPPMGAHPSRAPWRQHPLDAAQLPPPPPPALRAPNTPPDATAAAPALGGVSGVGGHSNTAAVAMLLAAAEAAGAHNPHAHAPNPGNAAAVQQAASKLAWSSRLAELALMEAQPQQVLAAAAAAALASSNSPNAAAAGQFPPYAQDGLAASPPRSPTPSPPQRHAPAPADEAAAITTTTILAAGAAQAPAAASGPLVAAALPPQPPVWVSEGRLTLSSSPLPGGAPASPSAGAAAAAGGRFAHQEQQQLDAFYGAGMGGVPSPGALEAWAVAEGGGRPRGGSSGGGGGGLLQLGLGGGSGGGAAAAAAAAATIERLQVSVRSMGTHADALGGGPGARRASARHLCVCRVCRVLATSFCVDTSVGAEPKASGGRIRYTASRGAEAREPRHVRGVCVRRRRWRRWTAATWSCSGGRPSCRRSCRRRRRWRSGTPTASRRQSPWRQRCALGWCPRFTWGGAGCRGEQARGSPWPATAKMQPVPPASCAPEHTADRGAAQVARAPAQRERGAGGRAHVGAARGARGAGQGAGSAPGERRRPGTRR